MSYAKYHLLESLATWDDTVDGPRPAWLSQFDDHPRPIVPAPDGAGGGMGNAKTTGVAAQAHEVADESVTHSRVPRP
jgi:hypothetical protein